MRQEAKLPLIIACQQTRNWLPHHQHLGLGQPRRRYWASFEALLEPRIMGNYSIICEGQQFARSHGETVQRSSATSTLPRDNWIGQPQNYATSA
jgi:hypothetical protein